MHDDQALGDHIQRGKENNVYKNHISGNRTVVPNVLIFVGESNFLGRPGLLCLVSSATSLMACVCSLMWSGVHPFLTQVDGMMDGGRSDL